MGIIRHAPPRPKSAAMRLAVLLGALLVVVHSAIAAVKFGQNDHRRARVELIISAKGLSDEDTWSKSDPMCVVMVEEEDKFGMMIQREVGRTEAIKNNLSPIWTIRPQLDYIVETTQVLHFYVYDVDKWRKVRKTRGRGYKWLPTEDLKDHKFLGEATCTLPSLYSAINGIKSMEISGGKGLLEASLVELYDEGSNMVELTIHGVGLPSKDPNGKSDPYLKIFALTQGEIQQPPLERTETQWANLNPTWNTIAVPYHKLCNNGDHQEFEIQCWDEDKGPLNPDDFIGSMRISFGELNYQIEQAKNGGQPAYKHVLIDKALVGKKVPKFKRFPFPKVPYVNSGHLQFFEAKIRPAYTFQDFRLGGMQLRFFFSVDFTWSNIDHTVYSYDGRMKPPLHNQFVRNGRAFRYKLAMGSVLPVVDEHNDSHTYMVSGYGAKKRGIMSSTSHFFYLNTGKGNKPGQAVGIGQVLSSYDLAMDEMFDDDNGTHDMDGPTHFANTINEARRYIEELSPNQDGSNYLVLLIITDGGVMDPDPSIKAIIDASFCSMSIIIIGVGDGPFHQMKVFDADEEDQYGRKIMLTLKEKVIEKGKVVEKILWTAARDIVQFVAYNEFRDDLLKLKDSISDAKNIVMKLLTKEVLKELPGQVTEHWKLRKVKPKPPPPKYTERLKNAPRLAGGSGKGVEAGAEEDLYPDAPDDASMYQGGDHQLPGYAASAGDEAGSSDPKSNPFSDNNTIDKKGK